MSDNKLKILVADDELEVLEITSRKLRENGYEVVLAADGVEAWERIRADNPDIVLLDVNMPRKDGLTVLRELRAHPPHPKWQPVIIISARNELEDFRQGLDCEADHYLAKPCAMTDILKAIRTMAALIPLRVNERAS